MPGPEGEANICQNKIVHFEDIIQQKLCCREAGGPVLYFLPQVTAMKDCTIRTGSTGTHVHLILFFKTGSWVLYQLI